MAGRDDRGQNKTVVQVAALAVLAFTIFLSTQPGVQIPFFVYCILGGVLLGVSDIGKLLSGFRFDGNDKEDK